MNKKSFHFRDLIWGVLPLLAAELAWTVTFCAAGAIRDRRRSAECLTGCGESDAE